MKEAIIFSFDIHRLALRSSEELEQFAELMVQSIQTQLSSYFLHVWLNLLVLYLLHFLSCGARSLIDQLAKLSCNFVSVCKFLILFTIILFL